MKKRILTTLLAAASSMLSSQILNSGFENLSTNGKVKNWGMSFVRTLTMDTNGVAHGDSIVFDQDFYFPSTDAHSGLRALEMRNAFNYTAGQQIAGTARLMRNDSDYTAFASMVSIQQRPASFSFYYKFLPVGSDTAYAFMSVVDSNGVEIGTSEINITGTSSSYALASQPVVYSTSDPAAYIAIVFATAKPGSPASFGTRFLVDDVGAAGSATATGLYVQNAPRANVKLFPNPVQDQLYIDLKEPLQGQGSRVEIRDPLGRLVQQAFFAGAETRLTVDTARLPKGLYALSIISNASASTHTFIK